MPKNYPRTVRELFEESGQKRVDYQLVIPLDKEGDIDEIDLYSVIRFTWDDAEKRCILEW